MANKSIALFLLSISLFISCNTSISPDNLAYVTRSYYQTYTDKDLEKWISYYDDSVTIHDICESRVENYDKKQV